MSRPLWVPAPHGESAERSHASVRTSGRSARDSGVLFTLVGVLVVALLIAAFAWGRRIRSREPGPPHPESQPRLPHGQLVGDSMESREPEELPRTDHRRKPHELKGNGIDSRRRD
ncbi:DUF6479 family protein [Streptomyces sp. bgisy130]|uniref:DUF6479 family protein n=1 Tax=Streptomyces sp. bgisy130 TaxID=3413788 RepID=UPI003F4A74DA